MNFGSRSIYVCVRIYNHRELGDISFIYVAVAIPKPADKNAAAAQTSGGAKPAAAKKKPAGDIDYAALLEKAREKSATGFATPDAPLHLPAIPKAKPAAVPSHTSDKRPAIKSALAPLDTAKRKSAGTDLHGRDAERGKDQRIGKAFVLGLTVPRPKQAVGKDDIVRQKVLLVPADGLIESAILTMLSWMWPMDVMYMVVVVTSLFGHNGFGRMAQAARQWSKTVNIT
jgi:hypothetical protein